MIKKTASGFTLVEALVAITILIIGVLGPLSLAAKGISDGLFAQNQLTANLLAQEAVETIINQRNSNVLEGLPPFQGIIEAAALENSSLGVDASASLTGAPSIRLNECPGADGCLLTYKEGQFYVKAENNEPALFSRKIEVSRSALDSSELEVKVVIKWKNKSVPQELEVVEFIYAD